MKRIFVLAAAIGASAIVVPAANAKPVLHHATVQAARFSSAQATSGGDTATGGCFFLADSSDVRFLTGVSYTGVIGDASVTRDSAGRPIGATVTCDIRVNGNTYPGTQHAFPGAQGAQAGVEQLAYTAIPGDFVSLCEDVHFSDGSDTGLVCLAATEVTTPAPVVDDLLDVVFGPVDAIVCPVLRSLAGSYPGPSSPNIVIAPDGDVYIDPIDANKIYDCPPYG